MSRIKDFYMDNRGNMPGDPEYFSEERSTLKEEIAMAKSVDFDHGDFYDQQMDKMFWGGRTATNHEDLIKVTEKYKDMMNNAKVVDGNLKTLAAINKPKLSDVPPVSLFALGAAMSDGAKKYGRYNWRETGATSSVFFDAIARHLIDWYNGEDYAHDSKVHHLGHIMASCAIILDSELNGNLNDDRADKPSIARNPTWIEK